MQIFSTILMMILGIAAAFYVRTHYEDAQKKKQEEEQKKKNPDEVNFRAVMDIGRERAAELKAMEEEQEREN